jgi:hypothetical protein
VTTPKNNAEYLRALRAKAVAEGRCYTCRLRPAKPGARYCVECIARTTEYRERIRYVKCRNCGAPVAGSQFCEDCAAKKAERSRRAALEAFASGLCTRCKEHPAHPGHAHCVECLDAQKDNQLARTRLRGARPRDACSICTSLGLSGIGHNARTHDRWLARRKAWAP